MAPSINNSNPHNIFDFVVNQGEGVKGLAELGLKSLPTQYIQPPGERFDRSIARVHDHDSIPVIDMSCPDDPKVAEAVCDAAHKWGFFQIVNHGVPFHVLEDVKDATHKFFGLPAQEKLKYSKKRSVTNNIRYGTSFSPEAEKVLKWKDYLSLLFVSCDEAASLWPSICSFSKHPFNSFGDLSGTNQHQVSSLVYLCMLRTEALAYIESSEIIVKKLLQILMKGLNVKEIDESKESKVMGSKRIKFNYYPKCPNPELTVGVGRHSDVSTLTVLLQDDVGGLYVRNTGTMNWIYVPPVSGSLVINVGDALQIMSNGQYKSVEHRVSASESNNRISIPIFVNPRPNDIIGPLPEVLKSGEKPVYKHVLYSDYVKHFFRKAHDGKATIEFAKA